MTSSAFSLKIASQRFQVNADLHIETPSYQQMIQLTFSILNSIGLFGLGYGLYAMFKGLTERVNALTALATEQKKTLDAVRERADEFDRLSKGYKQALSDFEEMGMKLETRRSKLVKELEEANQAKDQEIVALKKLEIEQVDLQKKSFAALPELVAKIQTLQVALQEQMDFIIQSSESKKKDDCFLTTACVDFAGLPDDCRELTAFRRFRDDYVASLPSGGEILDEYYRTAPKIVSEIAKLPHRETILSETLTKIRRIVDIIEAGHMAEAFVEYTEMFEHMKRTYSGISVRDDQNVHIGIRYFEHCRRLQIMKILTGLRR